MIKVKSNINEFLKNYKEKVEKLKIALKGIAEKLAELMAQDMYAEIQRAENIWAIDQKSEGHDETGKMGFHTGKGFDYWFEIQHIGTNAVRISIGENINPHPMKDGERVNPAYFIEFGFGVVGQQNPMKNADVYNWQYNKNNHDENAFPPTSPWEYEGFDGKFHISDGAKGINFMYNTIDKYRRSWIKYLKELMEQANV